MACTELSVLKTHRIKLTLDSPWLLASRLDTLAAFHIVEREAARISSPNQIARTVTLQHHEMTEVWEYFKPYNLFLH